MWWRAEVSAVDQRHQPRLGAAASCSLAVADVQLAEPAQLPAHVVQVEHADLVDPQADVGLQPRGRVVPRGRDELAAGGQFRLPGRPAAAPADERAPSRARLPLLPIRCRPASARPSEPGWTRAGVADMCALHYPVIAPDLKHRFGDLASRCVRDLVTHRDRRWSTSGAQVSAVRRDIENDSTAVRDRTNWAVLCPGGGQVALLMAGTSPTRADRQPRPRTAVGPSCRPSRRCRIPGCASRMSRPPGGRPRPPHGW
jgi:hypothetical protein